MPVLIWKFELEADLYTVSLEHGYWSGKRVLRMNNNLLCEDVQMIDYGSIHTFSIGSHTCAVQIFSGMYTSWKYGFGFRYECRLDGAEIPLYRKHMPQDTLLRPAEPPQAARQSLLRPAYGNEDSDPSSLLRSALLEPDQDSADSEPL